MLNRPPILLKNYKTDTQHLPVFLESDGISLEVIKKAEKENCLVIRLVKIKGCNSRGILKSTQKAVTIIETEITLNPFEIGTYRIKFS